MRKLLIPSIRMCMACDEIFMAEDKDECCGASILVPEDSLRVLMLDKVLNLIERRNIEMKKVTIMEKVEKVKKVKVTEVVNGKRRRIKIIKEKTITTKKKNTKHKIEKNIRLFVLKRDKNKCVECKCKTGLHIHHIIHRSKGGTDDPVNLKTLCDLCHAETHRGEPIYNIMIKSLFKIS